MCLALLLGPRPVRSDSCAGAGHHQDVFHGLRSYDLLSVRSIQRTPKRSLSAPYVPKNWSESGSVTSAPCESFSNTLFKACDVPPFRYRQTVLPRTRVTSGRSQSDAEISKLALLSRALIVLSWKDAGSWSFTGDSFTAMTVSSPPRHDW